MKQLLTEVGLYDSVPDNQIEEAKERAVELSALMFNDYWNGRKILSVTYEDKLPPMVSQSLDFDQAVLFKLSPE